MDDDYSHMKLVNSYKKKFEKLQKGEVGMKKIQEAIMNTNGEATENGAGQLNRNKNRGYGDYSNSY